MTYREGLREAFLEGYQQAVESMRSWTERFGTEATKPTLSACADLVELAKPTKEMMDV